MDYPDANLAGSGNRAVGDLPEGSSSNVRDVASRMDLRVRQVHPVLLPGHSKTVQAGRRVRRDAMIRVPRHPQRQDYPIVDDRLTDVETRVLGALIEKEKTTPESYPLSLNALTNACNQSSNRDPVVDYDEATVATALETLRK